MPDNAKSAPYHKPTRAQLRVIEACDEILIETGKLPTLDAIQERLKTGSRSTAHTGQQMWIRELSDRLNRVRGLPDIPDGAAIAITNLWDELTTANQALFDARKADIEKALVRANEDLEEAKTFQKDAEERAKQSDQLVGEKNDIIRALERNVEKTSGQLTLEQETTTRLKEEIQTIRVEAREQVDGYKRAAELAEQRQEEREQALGQQIGDLIGDKTRLEKDNASLSKQLIRAQDAKSSAEEKNKLLEKQYKELLKSLNALKGANRPGKAVTKKTAVKKKAVKKKSARSQRRSS